MFKKFLLAVIVLFVALNLIDWFVNSVFLMKYYQETASVWRPMEEMKWGVMYVMSFLSIVSFVYIYWKLISPKSIRAGIRYGMVWGFANGLGMGYGMYAMLPIPYILAISWFFCALIEFTIAGYLTALIVKESSNS